MERGDLKRGFEFILEGRLEEARAFFQEALRVDPEDVDARFGLGCVYAAMGQRDLAFMEWRRCVEVDPEMGEAHYALAWAYYDARDYEGGFRHVELAHRSGVPLDPLKEIFNRFVRTGKPLIVLRERPKLDERPTPIGWMAHVGCFIVISIICYLLLRGTLREGYPHNYLDATVAFYIAKLKMLLMNGFRLYTPVWYFGYELLRFYPPLSTLIPYLTVRLTGNLLTTYYALCLVYYALYVVGTYLFASRFLTSHAAGLLAALIWLVTHANVISFQGHYWETARLMGTALVPWTLYFVDRFLGEGRRADAAASILLASYVLLSSMLSSLDLLLFLIPFFLIRGGLAPHDPEPQRYSTSERMGRLLLLGLQGLLGLTLWWYIPALLPHGINVFFAVGRGRPPPLTQALFSIQPPSSMMAIQLPITLLGLLGALVAMATRDRRGIVFTFWFLSTTAVAYIIGLQSVRLILDIGFSLTLLSAFSLKALEEQLEAYRRRAGRWAALLLTLLIGAPLLYTYLPTYAYQALVDDAYRSTDEYLTARWLAENLNASYRVYVMYGDRYRGSQWLNTFEPWVRQVLGGFDQGGRAMSLEPFEFDQLVKWSTNSTEIYEMAFNNHIRYIIIDKYWMLMNSPYAYEKFKDGRYFIHVENENLKYAEIYEVKDVQAMGLDEGEYIYWNIWRVVGMIFSTFFLVIFINSLIKTRREKASISSDRMTIGVRRIELPIKFNAFSSLHLLNVTIIIIMTFFLGTLLYAWRIYPMPPGSDSISHLAKIRFILLYFPHIRWNHLWGSGMPLFRWYPPLFYLAAASLTYTLPIGIPEVAILMIFISYCFTAIGIYGFIWELVGDRRLSLLASTIALTTPAFWRMYTVGGLMSRMPSAAFYTLSLYAGMRFIKSENKRHLIITSLMISISTLSHLAFGAVALISCCLLYLILLKDTINKLKATIETIIMVFLFTAWFTIPFISPLPENPIVTKIPLKYFLNPLKELPFDAQGGYPNPLIIPLTIILIIIKLIKRKSTSLKHGIMIWSVLTSMILFIFSTQKLDPDTAMTIITISFLPISTYILSRMNRKRLSLFLLIGCVFIHVFTSPGGLERFLEKFMHLFGYEKEKFFEDVKFSLKTPVRSYYYRVGVAGSDGYAGQWFNYIYDVPQTREYYGQGIPHPEFYGLYSLIFYEEDEYNKSDFILDWYGIKWILAREDLYIKDEDVPHCRKFLDKPSNYILGGRAGHYYEFIYGNATPIMVTSKAISLLIIGDFNAYSDTFTSFMYSNRNSLYVIPIRGSRYIDDYTIDELSSFDAVLLRGYSWHDRDEAWRILEGYVRRGGSLIIETGYSPDSSSPFMPLPSPVESTYATDFGHTWNLTYVQNEITEGIRFESFSPLLYGERPWGVSASENETVRDWARPIVFEEGYPLIVVGQYGAGRVAWCGLNLPFHISSHRNYWESLLWFKLIAWTANKSDFGLVEYDFDRPNPEKVMAHIYEPAEGVLFKENIFKDWRAYLIDASGRRFKLDIYEAGPAFMYVHIPGDVQYPIDVIFKYSLGWEYLVGYSISFSSYIGAVIYVFNFFGIRRRRDYV